MTDNKRNVLDLIEDAIDEAGDAEQPVDPRLFTLAEATRRAQAEEQTDALELRCARRLRALAREDGTPRILKPHLPGR